MQPAMSSTPQNPPVRGGSVVHRSQFARTVIKVGAPTGLIVAGVIATVLVLGLNAATQPVLATVGLVLTGVVGVGIVFLYLWLDRWEPEPPRLLLLAWLWGGGMSIVFALVFGNLVPDGLLNAPFVEELAKGSFLVMMATGVRKRELNTLVDCLVYAGLAGAAFTSLEDITYIAQAGSIDRALEQSAIRILYPFLLGSLLHSLFTSMTAIGLWVGLQRRSAAAKWACTFAGYLIAVTLHALFNSGRAPAVFWLLTCVGTGLLAWLAQRRERRVLGGQLPAMVRDGLLTPAEVEWVASIRGRRAWRQHARTFAPQAAKDASAVVGALTELAFVRDRVDRGFGTPDTARRYDELTAMVATTPHPPLPPRTPPAVPARPLGPAGLVSPNPMWQPPVGARPAPGSHPATTDGTGSGSESNPQGGLPLG